MRVAAGLVQHLGEPQHVVGVAGLGTLFAVEHDAEIVDRVEVFPDAVAADGDGAVLHDRFPKEVGRFVPFSVPFDVGYPFESDDFRYLGVGVHAREAVFVPQQRLQYLLVGEAAGQLQVFFIAGYRSYVGKYLVQTTVLAGKHLLYLVVAQLRNEVEPPVGELDQHRPGLAAAGLQAGVAQAGKGLVYVVERDPFPVEVETAGPNVAAGYLFPHGPSAGNAAQVAVAGGLLAGLQFVEHVIESGFYLGVPGSGIHVGESRQVVAAYVAVEPAVFPVPVVGGFGSEPGLFPVGSQQPVGVKTQQVADVHFLRMFEGTFRQAYISDRETCYALFELRSGRCHRQ